MKEPIYGLPCVENPHDFEPARECCSEKEIESWEKAKLRWDAGERGFNRKEMGTYLVYANDDSLFPFIRCHPRWGIGVNMVEMEEA